MLFLIAGTFLAVGIVAYLCAKSDLDDATGVKMVPFFTIPGLWVYVIEGGLDVYVLSRWNFRIGKRRRPWPTSLLFDFAGITIFDGGPDRWVVWLGSRRFVIPRKVRWWARGR